MSAPSEKKANTEKLMVAGLLVVFGFTLLKGPLSKMFKSSAPVALASLPSGPAASAAPVTPAGSPAAALARTYTAREVRDPFQSRLPVPPSASVEVAASGGDAAPEEEIPEQPNLQVEGMLWGGPQPKAIINGDVYGVNDVVDGVTIVAIDRHGVAVDYGGRQPAYYMPSTAGGN